MSASVRTAAAAGGFVLALLSAAAGGAEAQEPVEETVIVTAHASPEPFRNLSRTVAVLTREQIARLPVRSVAEVLQYLASVDVQSRGAMGVQSDFSVRGASFGRTLVLVNGVRINDAQSGHHNSDVPIVLEEVDRVEVLYGSGSSLYGADAFGGTINIITRRPQGTRRQASLSAGQFGLVDGSAVVELSGASVAQSLGVTAARSSGFMPARGFETLGVMSQTAFGPRSSLLVSHGRKDFGANGFYGPAPSHERTDSTLILFDRRLVRTDPWDVGGTLAYRTHGDWFLYDPRAPSSTPNRHRTHAVEAAWKAQRAFTERFRMNAGLAIGGDWIRSNNLSDHAFGRGSVFVELQQRVGDGTLIYPGLRVDSYSRFGTAASPSLSVSSWVARRVKLRGSAGRAFRVPTFTELYYRDPNHEATPTLQPEHAWEAEAGVDVLAGRGWESSASAFGRWETNVIDWVRATPLVRWRTTNLRRVEARGIEIGVSRLLQNGGVARLDYAWLDADAGDVDFLSKYVLDYARHSLTATASLSLPARLSAGGRLAYKRRLDRRAYWVADARLSRRIRLIDVFIEGSNLLDTDYQEIRGVDMPGRWLKAGVSVPAF
jgi:iron complex outermembrane receptor protein